MYTKLHNLTVRFKHIPDQGLTECAIETETEGMSIGARAKCSANDQFNKATGRKLALLRAMKEYGLNRNQRWHEWEAYRTMTKVPRWPQTTLNIR